MSLLYVAITIYLLVSLEVVVEHIDTDGEISRVEWVGTVPPLWSKLSTFHYHRMKVDQGEENALELILTSTHLKSVLLCVCVCVGGGGGGGGVTKMKHVQHHSSNSH